MSRAFRHLHAAHCESGVTAALLSHHGLDLSEPMIFGIGSGLFFVHAPFLKILGQPLTAFRTWPGSIFRKVCKRLGVTFSSSTYRSPESGGRALDDFLERGVPVGLQVNVFWLPYLPVQFRSQFNAHNVIATGTDGPALTISDPILEQPVTCSREALGRARFARGPLQPRGRLYHPLTVPGNPDIAKAVRAGIRETCRKMLRTPPLGGVHGIRFLARRVRRLPAKHKDPRGARLELVNVVRMQEEIGTGGAGFRFMFAAFLQEAGDRLALESLRGASEKMTAAGDRWRAFAVGVARICREGAGDGAAFEHLSALLLEIADREEEVYRILRSATAKSLGRVRSAC